MRHSGNKRPPICKIEARAEKICGTIMWMTHPPNWPMAGWFKTERDQISPWVRGRRDPSPLQKTPHAPWLPSWQTLLEMQQALASRDELRWINRSIRVRKVHIRHKIEKLQRMTVARGCTLTEAQTAKSKIGVLVRKYGGPRPQ
jgi:hypothetical protein